MEKSALPSLRDGRSENQPEIVSSFDTSISEEKSSDNDRHKRNAVVSVTSTVTNYSFATTTVTKSFTLAAKNGLSCLPASYTVC